MQASLARKWAEALRSGKYKQQNYQLRATEEGGVVKHCCLGVLCEVMGEEKAMEHGLYLSEPRVNLLDKAGMSTHIENKLMELNNDCTFEEIADTVDLIRLGNAWHTTDTPEE